MSQNARQRVVKKDAAKLEFDFESGKVTAGKDLKLCEYADYFMEHHCRCKISPSTVVSYEDIIKNRILPEFGGRKLSQIHPNDINKLIDKLQKQGKTNRGEPLSDKTIHNILSC